jgi:hypothetical protein
LRKTGFVFILILIAFSLSRCKYDNVEELYPANEGYNCDTIFPSYNHDIIPIITTYCSDSSFGSCHQDNSQNVNLNDYNELKFLVDGGHIREHVIERHEMPPPYSLGPTELPENLIQKIDCWISHGAENN